MNLRQAEVDAEVLDACRRGDREAFRALYEAHKDRVYSIALYFFHGDRSLAADVTQEVFVKLLTNIAGFRGDAGFATWLYRLVTNACLDRTRRASSREAATAPEVLDTIESGGSVEQAFARSQTSDVVQRAISSLPAKLRLVILLRYFENLSYEDIAVTLNCSPGTIASRLNRGHKLLAERLAPLRDGLTHGADR